MKRPILILQHPQEPKYRNLSSAPILQNVLAENGYDVRIKTALSTRNLAHAWANENSSELPPEFADPKSWVVLYLGTKQDKAQPLVPSLVPLSQKGNLLPKFKNSPTGIVLLDGTWAQSKTLWWRNPWLLKLQRAMLVPKAKSLYGQKRKEPRKECVSTLEACAEVLFHLDKNEELEQTLKKAFSDFLKKP